MNEENKDIENLIESNIENITPNVISTPNIPNEQSVKTNEDKKLDQVINKNAIPNINNQTPTNNPSLSNEKIIQDINAEQNKNQVSKEPSLLKEQDEKEIKEEIPNKNIILVGIFFTIMFLFIMFLPTINSYVTKLKEKKLEEQIVDPKDENDDNNNQEIPGNTNGKEVQIFCTSKETTMADNSSMTIMYTFTHVDNKVKKTKTDMFYRYPSNTSENFMAQEKKCDKEINKNNNKQGYNANCTLEENTITVTETFDLTKFKTFTATNGTTITPVVELDSNMQIKIEELQKQGYTCTE